MKEREAQGYAYDGADASFELLARRALGTVPKYFDVLSFRVIVEERLRTVHRAKPTASRDQQSERNRGEHQDEIIEHERAEPGGAGGDDERQRDAFGRHDLAPTLEIVPDNRRSHFTPVMRRTRGRPRKAKK